MCKYEMNSANIVEDIERSGFFNRRMGGWRDGRTHKMKPVYPTQLCCWEEISSIKMASNMQKFQIAY